MLDDNVYEYLILAPEYQAPNPFSASIKAAAQNLGIIFDQSPPFDAHIKSVTRCCFFHLSIAKLRTLISKGGDACPRLHLLVTLL